jgi:hypothetical protein
MPRIHLLLVLTLVLAAGCPTGETEDAGDDASMADGPSLDGSARCTTDDDCDDDLFCNGDERCVMGACRPGADPCDDGIECTIDACSEGRRRCFSDPPDEDGDGAFDASCLDGSGAALGDDCDDADSGRFPGNIEVCDADDEDCDDTTFGGVDDDHDGYQSQVCCNGASCGDDCDDARIGSFPGATEVCDGLDQNCDGTVDDGVSLAGFLDRDGDGWGDDAMPMPACAGTPGWAPRGGDCNDDPLDANARAQSPGQPEICDGIRNDCTALPADEGAGSVDWYADLDGDGFGAASSGVTRSCAPVAMASLLATDCNDDDRMINPAAAERCNGVDDNCDGSANFRIGTNDFEDDDGDGLTDLNCSGGTDCNDADPASGPGEFEVCDLQDNDCDTRIDEGAPSAIYYRDIDRDGYGALASGSVVACMSVPGYVLAAGDCNDRDATRRPGAIETCDSADEDCDAAIDETPASSMCSLPDTSSYCLAGRCFVDTCDAGRADCDGRSVNGCERNVLSDAFHCGTCGTMCPGLGPCGGGTCVHSAASMVGGASWSLPRLPVVTIDTPEPGARVAYVTQDIPLGDGTGFWEQIETTPFEVDFNFAPGATEITLNWRVIHAPGLLEDVQTTTFTIDEAAGGLPRGRSGAIVEHLDIAGSGPIAAVGAGASFTLEYDVQVWGRSGVPAAVGARIWIGMSPGDCVMGPASSPYPGETIHRSSTLTAPTVPGIYPLSLTTISTCESVTSLLGTNDIGYLIVGS